MFSWESRPMRRSGRDARRPDITAAVEHLEARELLATNVLGASLPDLIVSGIAPPVASWGNPIAVTVNVQNIGVSSALEPLALAPGSTGSADAVAATVGVYATRKPGSLNGAVLVGLVDVPAISANNAVQVTQAITLPVQPAGFPGDGGRIYLTFVVNPGGGIVESDATNNVSAPVPVQIQAPLPELVAVGLDVPPVMQPGDTIQPNIRVANFGPGDPAAQGVPIQVALVASRTRNFTPASSVVALYNLTDVPPQTLAPTQNAVFADANLIPGSNIVTIAGDPVTLPTTPGKYYLGVVVDPYGFLKQLRNVPQAPATRNTFSLIQTVGPPIPGLPPAGVDVAGGMANVPLFPIPFGGNPVGGLPNGGGFPVPFPPQSISTITGTTPATPGIPTIAAAAARSGVHTASALAALAARRASILGMFHGASSSRTGVVSAPAPRLARLTRPTR